MLYNNGLDNSQTRMLVEPRPTFPDTTPRCRRRLCKGKRKGVRGSEGPERTFVVRCLRPVVRAVMWRRGLGGGCGERQWVDLGGSRGEWPHLIWRIENIRPKPGLTFSSSLIFTFRFSTTHFDQRPIAVPDTDGPPITVRNYLPGIGWGTRLCTYCSSTAGPDGLTIFLFIARLPLFHCFPALTIFEFIPRAHAYCHIDRVFDLFLTHLRHQLLVIPYLHIDVVHRWITKYTLPCLI